MVRQRRRGTGSSIKTGPGERRDGELDTILVLDFGGQYCHLIGRRIRELGVYSEILPPDISPEEILSMGVLGGGGGGGECDDGGSGRIGGAMGGGKGEAAGDCCGGGGGGECDDGGGDGRKGARAMRVRGLILSGGPSSVHDPTAPRCHPGIFELGLPVLGICYGHQLIAHFFGGDVRRSSGKEYGATTAKILRPGVILAGMRRREKVWMSHADTVFGLPDGWETLARTEHTPVAAFRDPKRRVYGLQWHPEVAHTVRGRRMISNFVFRVCGCRRGWTMRGFVREAVSEIRRSVGGARCIIGLSGGVDSSTAAALASRGIGRRLVAVFVDHGFMREGEPEAIARAFKGFPMRLICVDARRRFMERLRGVSDPEEKRRAIGEEFVRVFEEEAAREGAVFLIQGTIYPDRIESGFRRHSDRIKSHHNVAGIPADVRFKGIIEPLRNLYKDEVRRVARQLGLPSSLVRRQPFPGPGLAVRVMGELTEERVEIVRRADRIVTEEIERAHLDSPPWQYFAVLTDTRSVGVKGDSRSYGAVVAVRAVSSREAMTASFHPLPYAVLERISTRITNEIPQVSRVVYDITHKPPGTIEWE
ncbi:MAG: glutamine-hydrolyzing GMP synthase [Thermoplasmatota archaeon]